MSCARLALGTAQIGLDYGVARRAGRPSAAEVDRILRTALDLGIEYIDTAAAYGDAESAIGHFLRAARRAGPLRVGTKTPRFPSRLEAADLARELARSVDRSRARLDTDRIDDLLIHAADNLREYGQTLVDHLEQHRQAGRVGRIGISIYDADDAHMALEYPSLAVTQFPFNVLHRELVECGVVLGLRRAGHETFVRSALLQGLLALDPERSEAAVPGAGTWIARFRTMCAGHALDPVAAALAYAATASGADFVVVGVESADELEYLSHVLSRSVPLPAGFADQVAAAFAHVPPAVRDPRSWTGRVP